MTEMGSGGSAVQALATSQGRKVFLSQMRPDSKAIDWSLSAADRHQQRIARPQSESLNRPNGLARHQRQGKMLDDGREHEARLLQGERRSDAHARPDAERKIGIALHWPRGVLQEAGGIEHARIVPP